MIAHEHPACSAMRPVDGRAGYLLCALVLGHVGDHRDHTGMFSWALVEPLEAS